VNRLGEWVQATGIPLLVTTIAGSACAFPIEHVLETMRTSGVEGDRVRHRGDSVPVIDGVALLAAASAASSDRRCVIVRVGDGRAGVIVDGVVGIVRVDAAKLVAMRPAFAGKVDDVEHGLRVVLDAVRVLEDHDQRR